MKILVTGSAGFIGYHLTKYLAERGDEVLSVDNINDYYDTSLKFSRLDNLGIPSSEIEYNKIIASSKSNNLHFCKIDLADSENLSNLFEFDKFDAVCNLAAQAGVRYSIENPKTYIDSNIIGFFNILEFCRNNNISNLSYASSSSVYGLNKKIPFSELDNVDHPISLYAASKKSNELMAHTYSHLFKIQTTGLRFFTVYGPWGRPDMALFKFTKAAYDGTEIDVYNYGEMLRDFTYVDDIVDGIVKVIDNPAVEDKNWDPSKPSPFSSSAPFRVFNIGRSQPVSLSKFIELIEKYTKKEIKKEFLPMQDGDVKETFADTSNLRRETGYNPSFSVEEGVKRFIEWYINFYK